MFAGIDQWKLFSTKAMYNPSTFDAVWIQFGCLQSCFFKKLLWLPIIKNYTALRFLQSTIYVCLAQIWNIFVLRLFSEKILYTISLIDSWLLSTSQKWIWYQTKLSVITWFRISVANGFLSRAGSACSILIFFSQIPRICCRQLSYVPVIVEMSHQMLYRR